MVSQNFQTYSEMSPLDFKHVFHYFSQSWGDDEDEHFTDALDEDKHFKDAPEEDEETPMKERNEDGSIATESPKSKAPSWLHRKNVYHKGKLRFSAGFVTDDLLFLCP